MRLWRGPAGVGVPSRAPFFRRNAIGSMPSFAASSSTTASAAYAALLAGLCFPPLASAASTVLGALATVVISSVRFFESLPKSVRADYDALATLDRQFGEDADRQRLRAKS